MSRYGKNMTVKGLDQLIQHLEHLPDEIRGKVGRAATARAADFLRNEIVKNTPRAAQAYRVTLGDGTRITRSPGDLARALIIKYIPEAERKRNAASCHKITFKRGADVHGIGYIAHFLEYGTSPHEITLKNGNTWQHPGTQAQPFIEPTFKANKKQIEQIIKQAIQEAVRNAI